jgi:hypothetical protein
VSYLTLLFQLQDTDECRMMIVYDYECRMMIVCGYECRMMIVYNYECRMMIVYKSILVRHVVESLRQNIVYTPSTQHIRIKS